jgi:hypothetical protein
MAGSWLRKRAAELTRELLSVTVPEVRRLVYRLI